MHKVLEEMQARGLVELVSHQDELSAALTAGPMTFYVGFDPTADSLHVGHLLPLVLMRRLQRAGHRPLAIVGGATGMIGDPSGRSTERNLLTAEQVSANVEALRAQLSRFVVLDGEQGILLNNADWIGPMTYLEWLRDVGKHFSVNAMLARESVKRRIEARDEGISYTEFSYMLLQAYDFLHLHRTHGCTLQAGGNDQWGNILSGIDLIRRQTGGDAFGLTVPLVTTASGEKFGKSAGNAVWLDARRTSPYAFYQFWLRTEDADIDRFLRLFSDRGLEEIATLLATHGEDPGRRTAQRALAEEMTLLVHGAEGLASAEKVSGLLFGQAIEDVSATDLEDAFGEMPSALVDGERLRDGYAILDLLVDAKVFPSKGEARRRLQAGGVYLNNHRVASDDVAVSRADHVAPDTVVLRAGKRNYCVVRGSAASTPEAG